MGVGGDSFHTGQMEGEAASSAGLVIHTGSHSPVRTVESLSDPGESYEIIVQQQTLILLFEITVYTGITENSELNMTKYLNS